MPSQERRWERAAYGLDVVFVHGAGGRGAVWQLQLLKFPRALAPDLPGRDRAFESAAGTRGVDGYLDALRAQLGETRRWIVAGHSLGGGVALRWALRYPAEVRALVLIGTGARLRVAPAMLERIRAGDAAAVEEFGRLWFAPQTDPRLREKSLALLRATPLEVLMADLAAADQFDVMDQVGTLSLPALVICGAEDRLAPVKFGQYLHTHIEGSELVIVPGAGHMVMIEQAQATNAAILAFLERLDREAQAWTERST
jgi:pimeloyl-ACP methyl ester carboxylesterase